MVEWRLLEREFAKRKWDLYLSKFTDRNCYQTFGWGEYKGSQGWTPYRWAAFDENNKIAALFQGLFRKFSLGLGLLWGPGGPIGDIETWGLQLRHKILDTLRVKKCYCRFYPQRQYNQHDVLLLKGHGWQRVLHPISSGLSMWIDPMQDDEQLISLCSKNWRRNLRRAGKHDLNVYMWDNPNAKEVISIYKSMQSYKKIKEQYSLEQLENLFDKNGRHIVLFRCDNAEGQILGLRGCTIFANRAWELLAATNEKGRKVYSSYALLWALIQYCRSLKMEFYDVSGIDPFNNLGVYNFKKGIGGSLFEYLGEWDWATSEWLRWGFNLAIKFKGKFM